MTTITAKSKLGIHLNRNGSADATAMLIRAEPAACLGVNIGPPGEVYDYGKQQWRGREMIWVARVYENDFQINLTASPNLTALNYFNTWLAPYAKQNPWVRFLAGPNEVVISKDDPLATDKMRWLALFTAELVRLIHEGLHLTAVVGNWSVGCPDWPMWPYYIPALEAIRKYGAYHSRHSYGPLTEAYALRHRRDNECFTALGYPDLPTLLTEVGWEQLWESGVEINRPWASDPRRSKEEYADYLTALNAELLKDAYVHGAMLFTHGEPWPQHCLNDSGVGQLYGDRLAGHAPFNIALPQPGAAPTGPVTPEPVQRWLGKRIQLTGNCILRSGPSKANTTRLTAIYAGTIFPKVMGEENGWVKVTDNGWVTAGYIKEV